MPINPRELLGELEMFELTHAIALENAFIALLQSLRRAELLDLAAIDSIDAAYHRAFDQQSENPLLVSILKSHEKAFATLRS